MPSTRSVINIIWIDKFSPLRWKMNHLKKNYVESAEGVVNDRGPCIRGRDVDVSYGMAKQLGFVEKGVTKLKLEMLQAAGASRSALPENG